MVPSVDMEASAKEEHARTVVWVSIFKIMIDRSFKLTTSLQQMPPQAGLIATKELRFLYLLFLLYSSCSSCFNAEYTKPEPFNEGEYLLGQSSSLQNPRRAGQLKILRKLQSSKIPSRVQIEIAWEATMKWIVGSTLRMVQTDSKHIAQWKASLTNFFDFFFKIDEHNDNKR